MLAMRYISLDMQLNLIKQKVIVHGSIENAQLHPMFQNFSFQFVNVEPLKKQNPILTTLHNYRNSANFL